MEGGVRLDQSGEGVPARPMGSGTHGHPRALHPQVGTSSGGLLWRELANFGTRRASGAVSCSHYGAGPASTSFVFSMMFSEGYASVLIPSKGILATSTM